MFPVPFLCSLNSHLRHTVLPLTTIISSISAMRFYYALAQVVAMAQAALAAECFSQVSSSDCGTRDGVAAAARNFCSTFATRSCGRSQYTDESNDNTITFGATAAIPNQNACLRAASEIIDQCFGQRTGGSYNVGSFSVVINFCG
jgi:hypothetical protein